MVDVVSIVVEAADDDGTVIRMIVVVVQEGVIGIAILIVTIIWYL